MTEIQQLPIEARQVLVSSIVAEGRIRRELGDIESLMESMQSLRLINPITVTPKRELIAGGRRLEAAVRLGWKNIPCTVVDSLSDATWLLMERDENTCRKEMTHSERMDLARRLEALEKPKAEKRMKEGWQERGTDPSAERRGGPEQPRERPKKHRVSEVIGPAVGLSQRSYERARAIEDATEDERPEVAEFAQRLTAALESGATSITAAERELRQAKKEAQKPTHTPEEPPAMTTPGKPAVVSKREHQRLEKDAAWWIKTLGNITNSLDGTIVVFDELLRRGVPNTLDEDEARELVAGLDRFTRATGRIKKSITNR